MLDSLIKSVENSFVQFSFGRLLYLIFLSAIVIFGLYAFNESTGYSTSQRIDHQITALERLHSLSREGIKDAKELMPIYNSIIKDINIKKDRNWGFNFSINTTPMVKVISATIIVLMFVIHGLFGVVRKKEGASSLLGGALMFALILGILAFFMPLVAESLKLTAGILFSIQVLLLFAITKFFN